MRRTTVALATILTGVFLSGCATEPTCPAPAPAGSEQVCYPEDRCELDYQGGRWLVRVSADYTQDGQPGPWLPVTAPFTVPTTTP